MRLNYLYLAITMLVGIVAFGVSDIESFDFSESKPYNASRNDIRSKLKIFAVNFILIAFSAFRKISAESIDEDSYRRRFILYSEMGIKDVFRETKEYLFNGGVWLATKVFKTDQGIIIVSGALTVILLLIAIRRYSKNYAYGILLLMLTGTYFNTFNGIQQCLAAAIFFSAIYLVYTKDFKKFLLVLIICVSIHTASLVLLIFYFYANIKFKSLKQLYICIIFISVLMIAYYNLPDFITKTGMLNEYADPLSQGRHGVSILRIIVNVIPSLIALFIPSRIYEENKLLNLSANFVFLNSIIYIASSVDTYIARFALFTFPFIIIFLVNVLEYVKISYRTAFKVISVAFYSAFMFVESSNSIYNFNFTL